MKEQINKNSLYYLNEKYFYKFGRHNIRYPRLLKEANILKTSQSRSKIIKRQKLLK